MKNVLIISAILLLFSCSKNDDSSAEQERNWTIKIQDDCPGGIEFTYCITNDEYLEVKILINQQPGEPCRWVSFEDINGNNQSGYFRTAATGSNPCS